ncbi:MAG: CofH family radical SAM protein [Phycisphaerae bacterium]|nr:CofH family radical SAM protein [Phycisphaerae bacterium]MCZ2400744.1 CofH family radical SAM protein [Phycisphaerae bacterium]NUQ48384.1 CofH family radical SAM protein [Phycisphaerae bacterium]
MQAAADTPVSDPALEPIRERVLAGERLSIDDGVALYRSRDIFTIGELANIVRERRHGRAAYYNINRHINYTNYCVLRCKFCSFYRSPDGRTGLTPLSNTGGYEYSLDEIVEIAAEAYANRATEVHIVGGLHPKLPFSFYTDVCRAIKQRCPGLHVKAFTAIEIIHFTRISKPRLSIEEVLIALKEAGLDSLPGGGAEIFDDRVHAEAFKAKVGEKHWFDVHRAAHNLGIPSNATMLYGHVETPEERIRHLVKLREHQDESLARLANSACRIVKEGGSETAGDSQFAVRQSRSAAFQCCIPLSFIPEGSALEHLPGPTGLDDLRTLAISRLMLDNIPHIKAFWIMQTPKLSQVALNWGVDDFDGTVVWYDITKREGRGTNRQELTVDQIRRLILEAGCVPVERDTLYRPVRRGGEQSSTGRTIPV